MGECAQTASARRGLLSPILMSDSHQIRGGSGLSHPHQGLGELLLGAGNDGAGVQRWREAVCHCLVWSTPHKSLETDLAGIRSDLRSSYEA